MFQEQDQGKPKRWGSLILIIVLVVSLCLAIVVVCRILLDSEDEINEPIIQGELREKMNMFLGIFTMTFFFGFCCCFCCGCICCRWLFNDCPSATRKLFRLISDMLVSYNPPFRRRFSNPEPVEAEDMVDAARGIITTSLPHRDSDRQAFESAPPIFESYQMERVVPTNLILPGDISRKRSMSIDVGRV